jgi:hypothetical protein
MAGRLAIHSHSQLPRLFYLTGIALHDRGEVDNDVLANAIKVFAVVAAVNGCQ